MIRVMKPVALRHLGFMTFLLSIIYKKRYAKMESIKRYTETKTT